ncbi:hypothetical protein ENUP19_0003G0067 [Entamoeba nuttalli]|uniref:Uncharacterized protein n=1 Tax=Entamoeba nuttalli TaxID=412467 RepID=A0ABQ0D7F8_9EUKA
MRKRDIVVIFLQIDGMSFTEYTLYRNGITLVQFYTNLTIEHLPNIISIKQ